MRTKKRKPAGTRKVLPKPPERTKGELELQGDLDGCRLRLNQVRETLDHTIIMTDAVIARQREWIAELERRLARALNEVAELRGEGDDETP